MYWVNEKKVVNKRKWNLTSNSAYEHTHHGCALTLLLQRLECADGREVGFENLGVLPVCVIMQVLEVNGGSRAVNQLETPVFQEYYGVCVNYVSFVVVNRREALLWSQQHIDV